MNSDFGILLSAARQGCGFTQGQLARACTFHQTLISDLETGKRAPTFQQVQQLARVLKVPLQWFVTGSYQAGNELTDISIQLQSLGIGDLHVENERVPGAFLHEEEVLALAVAGNAPSPRIVEALPAALAWNAWDPSLLLAFADKHDTRARCRLGWLADVALTLHQTQGFPGGCKVSQLETYVRLAFEKKPDTEDAFGYSGAIEQLPPVSLRWKVRYPASLATFRERAEHLQSLRTRRLPRALRVS